LKYGAAVAFVTMVLIWVDNFSKFVFLLLQRDLIFDFLMGKDSRREALGVRPVDVGQQAAILDNDFLALNSHVSV